MCCGWIDCGVVRVIVECLLCVLAIFWGVVFTCFGRELLCRSAKIHIVSGCCFLACSLLAPCCWVGYVDTQCEWVLGYLNFVSS